MAKLDIYHNEYVIEKTYKKFKTFFLKTFVNTLTSNFGRGDFNITFPIFGMCNQYLEERLSQNYVVLF